MSNVSIPVATRIKIFWELAKLGGQAFDYEKKLVEKGVSAHRVHLEFMASFCKECETKEYRRYLVECAKENLGGAQCWGEPNFEYGGYISPMLQERRTDVAKKAGSSEFDSSEVLQLPIWDRQLNPCESRFYFQRSNDANFAQLFDSYQKRRRTCFQKVADMLVKEDYSKCDFADGATRSAVLNATLNNEFSRFGFVLDKHRTTKNYPVLSVPLNATYSLCIGIFDYGMLVSAHMANVDLVLFIDQQKFRGRLSSRSGSSWQKIDIGNLVPGYLMTYRQCSSFSELVLSVRSFALLFSFVEQQIRSACISALSEACD